MPAKLLRGHFPRPVLRQDAVEILSILAYRICYSHRRSQRGRPQPARHKSLELAVFQWGNRRPGSRNRARFHPSDPGGRQWRWGLWWIWLAARLGWREGTGGTPPSPSCPADLQRVPTATPLTPARAPAPRQPLQSAGARCAHPPRWWRPVRRCQPGSPWLSASPAPAGSRA